MNTESKHTKGWRLDDYGPNSGNIVRGELFDERGLHIAELLPHEQYGKDRKPRK